MTKKIVFITLILFFNGLTNTTPLNLLITLPQFGIVLYYIIIGRLEKATYWHFIFFITSFTYYGDLNIQETGYILLSYNYAKFKFFGPISYSYLISIILMIVASLKYSSKKKENYLFYKFYQLLLFFMISGFGIGLIGMAFRDYYIEGLVQYGSYILIIFIHATLLLKMNSTSLRKQLFDIIPALLALFEISTFLLHQINPQIVDLPAASFYSILLLPALLYQKNVILSLIGLFFIIYNSIIYGNSGKGLILLLLIAFITLFLSTTEEVKKQFPIRSKIIHIGILFFLIAVPSIATLIAISYGGSSFLVSKIHQAKSLLEFALLKGGVEIIAPSPYIRVTSLINILYEGFSNPFTLLFGKGYGGYFNDHFNFFLNLDLASGAFSDKEISSGDFFTGHDSMVTVPMFNGIIGIVLLLKIVWKYIVYSKYNYFLLSCIPFLLLAFYHDTLLGVTGVLLLFIGSHSIVSKK